MADPRKEACERLKVIETSGELDSTKYLFKNLYARYIRQKHKQGLSKGYVEKIESLCERYLLPDLGDLDVKDIKFSYLLDLLNAVFDQSNPHKSCLETIISSGYHFISMVFLA